jgi:ribonuclease-3
VQARGLPLPEYRVVTNTGPAHAPKFIIELVIKGYEPVPAEGNSKRAAEKSAAELFLKQIQG